MEDKHIIVGAGLPWLAIAIGALSGWIATGTVEGLGVGVLCGIVISVATYVGLIPILGTFLYHWIASALFSWVGIDMPLLYWCGMVFVLIYNIIVVIMLLIILSER